MRRKAKAQLVLERLAEVIQVPETELHYGSPWELLVAVMLSAQCTDKRVNQITPALFQRFPSPQAMTKADFEEVFSYIKGISYPANKARHLLGTAAILVNAHGGEVPQDFEALLALPGVGRKTANVVTSVLWQAPRIAVDTHVFRVANRIGLAKAKTPLQCEQQLMQCFRPEQLPDAHHFLILHGRYTCIARKPNCGACSLTGICNYFRRTHKPA